MKCDCTLRTAVLLSLSGPWPDFRSWQMIQKHLLLLVFPDPALAAMVEGPPANRNLWAVGEGSKTRPWHVPGDVLL